MNETNKLIAYTVVELEKLTKERPRTSFYTRSIYTPTSTKKREKIIAQEFIAQNRGWVCDKSPIKILLEIELKIPESATKTKKQKMLNDEIKATVKPDIDNVQKLVQDALNGVAYIDDKQIINLNVNKKYGEKNKLKIFVGKVL